MVVPNPTLQLDIVGIKRRVAGDAVREARALALQGAIDAEFKRVTPGPPVGGVLDSVAAKRNGVAWHASATKLSLAAGILGNGTLHATEANQNGLVGFGASRQGGYGLEPGLSVARLLRQNLAPGAG